MSMGLLPSSLAGSALAPAFKKELHKLDCVAQGSKMQGCPAVHVGMSRVRTGRQQVCGIFNVSLNHCSMNRGGTIVALLIDRPT